MTAHAAPADITATAAAAPAAPAPAAITAAASAPSACAAAAAPAPACLPLLAACPAPASAPPPLATAQLVPPLPAAAPHGLSLAPLPHQCLLLFAMAEVAAVSKVAIPSGDAPAHPARADGRPQARCSHCWAGHAAAGRRRLAALGAANPQVELYERSRLCLAVAVPAARTKRAGAAPLPLAQRC